MSPIFTSPPRRGHATICYAKGSATNGSSSPGTPGSTPCFGCPLCSTSGLSCGRAAKRCWRGEDRKLILMTGHRRESFDGGLTRICRAIARIAQRRDVAIVFPVHPNPNVRRAIEPLRLHQNILLVEPVDYPELVYLLKKCHFVVTDSGGIQEEAPSF